MIQRFVGDLLTVRHGIIVHGVNCKGMMGAGIAASIKAKWPRVFEQYRAACIAAPNTEYDLLGTIDVVELIYEKLYLVNAFTQFNPGPDARYDAIAECFGRISIRSDLMHLPVCFPLIGCGIGGLKWPVVAAIISEYLPFHEKHLYVLP